MRQEVLDFYETYNIPVEKMVAVGMRRGLDADSVRESAEIVYEEIKGGLDIEDIRIAWRVYSTAKHIAPKMQEEKKQTLEELHQMVSMIHKRYSTPWYKRLWSK